MQSGVKRCDKTLLINGRLSSLTLPSQHGCFLVKIPRNYTHSMNAETENPSHNPVNPEMAATNQDNVSVTEYLCLMGDKTLESKKGRHVSIEIK